MLIFHPYHALSLRHQVSLFKFKSQRWHIFHQKHKYTIHHLANMTIMIYIISHAYNMLINENKYLPRLGIGWSCSKRKFSVWSWEKWFWEISRLGMRLLCVKNMIYGPLYKPSLYPSRRSWKNGSLTHFGPCVLFIFLGPFWGSIHLTQ